MKNIIISILALAALASCSKNKNTDPDKSGELVAIRLGAGVETSSKAPISGAATVQIEGWESAATVDYTTSSLWQSTASVSVAASAASITLSPVQYYNADASTLTYIKGWYPAVASVSGVVTFTNNDKGEQDVLLSNVVSGSKGTNIATPMTFAHKTAQLIFKVIKGEGLAVGTQIKSIKVQNAKVPTSIDLATDVVTYSDKGDLEVLNITAADITTTAASAGDPLMIGSVDDSKTLKLVIETQKADGTVLATYNDVTFSTAVVADDRLVEGTAYTITLTFGQAGISIDANITDWTPAAGSGSVQ